MKPPLFCLELFYLEFLRPKRLGLVLSFITAAWFSPVELTMVELAVAEPRPALPPYRYNNIEDKALKACIEKSLAKDQVNKASNLKTLRCHSMGIKSLQGLDQLLSLEKLSLHNNQISDISDVDINSLTQLKHLNLAKNNLRRLSVLQLGKLEELYIFGNQLTQLKLENLPNLRKAKANSNKIATFSYTKLPKLTKLYLFDNAMEDMDIDHLPSIKYLDVRENPMPDELYDRMDELEGVTVLHDGNAEDWR